MSPFLNTNFSYHYHTYISPKMRIPIQDKELLVSPSLKKKKVLVIHPQFKDWEVAQCIISFSRVEMTFNYLIHQKTSFP